MVALEAVQLGIKVLVVLEQLDKEIMVVAIQAVAVKALAVVAELVQ